MMDSFSALSATDLAGVALSSRLAFVATVNNLGRNREITDEQVAFYAERARGGAALVITEGLSVHPTSIPNGTVPLAYDDRLVAGFRRLADAVHGHGQLAIGQLWHVGRQALWNPALQPWSPSGERDPYSGSTPHQMTREEIAEVVAGYVRSARNLSAAGFDGVELHGAHGYLITQFLSPYSNRRADEYGGSTANRTRMLAEIIDGIRAACGDSFLLGLKLSAHEYVDGGLDLAETQDIVALLAADHRPDYLAVSQANFSPSLEYHVPDLNFPDAPFADLARGVREVADGVATMALAKVPDVATASALVDDGVADLVGMSRAWLADSQLVARTRAGETPRPCVYCNVCWDFIHTGRPVACIYAPETGRELEHAREGRGVPTHRRTVHVVGAGIAGLETARVVATEGHDVVVHEASDRAGGRLAWEASVPGREPMARAANWLADAARRAGATIRLEDPVDPTTVAGWPPGDVVVIATGARPTAADLLGVDGVHSLEWAWRNRDSLAGPIVVIDEVEEEPVYAAATALAAAGHQVHLVTRREAVARRVAYVSKIGVLRRLDEQGVAVHTLVVPLRVADGRLIGRHAFSGREQDVCPARTIVSAGPYVSDPTEWPEGPGRHVVGDASAPRDYVAISQEAHRVARAISTTSAAQDVGGAR